MEKWKKHRVLALLLAMLLFFSVGLSSWNLRAEEVSGDTGTENVAEMTEEPPVGEVQPPSDEEVADAPVEAPAEEEDVISEEEDQQIAPLIEDPIPAEEPETPAEDVSTEKEEDVDAPADEAAPAEKTESEGDAPADETAPQIVVEQQVDDTQLPPGFSRSVVEEIVEEEGVLMLLRKVSLVAAAGPLEETVTDPDTGAEYDVPKILYVEYTITGAGSDLGDKWPRERTVLSVDTIEARTYTRGTYLTATRSTPLTTYGGADTGYDSSKYTYIEGTQFCVDRGKATPTGGTGTAFLQLNKTRGIVGGTVEYVAFGYSSLGTESQRFGMTAYLKMPDHQDYYIALKKVDDAGTALNDVSFDITVNGTTTTADYNSDDGKTGIWTGWKYHYDTGLYTNRRSLNDGIGLVYLGSYTQKPTVTVKENWTKKLSVNSPDPKDYTVVYSRPYTYQESEIYTDEADALAHAADPNTLWKNNKKVDWYIALKKVDDAGNPLNDVSFDITVDGVEETATKTTGVWTGWYYDWTDHSYANRKTAMPGVAVVYLGQYEKGTKPSVTVKENWTIKLTSTSPDPKNYTVVYTAPYTYKDVDFYHTEEDAIANAGNANTLWKNNERGSLTLTKSFSDSAKECVVSEDNNGRDYINPNYSLEGAIYGVYKKRSEASNDTNVLARFTTNAKGKGVVSYVTGDWTGMGTTKLSNMEQGTYYVKEITPSKNCEKDETIYTVIVERNATTNKTDILLEVEEDVIPDPVQIEIRKQNAAGEVAANNGDYDLSGAQFTIKFWPYDETQNYTAEQFTEYAAQGWEPQKTWVFETKLVNDEYRIRFSDDYKVSGDDLFYDENNDPGLPLGWITIEETKAPDGFTLTGGRYFHKDPTDGSVTELDGNVLVAKVTSAGKLIVNNSLELTNGMELNNANVPKRGDVDVQKVDKDGNPMAGVMFRITNTDTGEAHIIATDVNGYSSTEASYQKHSENTGYYDNGAAYDGTKAGVWFAKNKTGADTPVSDAYGALCPGNYKIEELETTENDGYQYEVAKEFTITGDETETVSFNFVNYPAPEFTSELLCTTTGSHILENSDNNILTDTISFANIKAGETYTLRGQLKLIDQNGNVSDYGPEVTKTFTTDANWTVSPFEKSGTETIQYTGIKYEDVLGKKLVSYQRLYLGDTADDTNVKQYDGYPAGSRMATLFPFVDEDPDNEKQTVSAITGHTTAMAPDESETLTSVGTVTLTDRVYFKGLHIGTEYELTSVLHVRPKNATGNEVYTQEELDAMRLLDENGKPITATKKFTATVSEGYVDVEFTFDASVLKQKATTIVCFEYMKVLPEDVEVFAETNIFDTEQSKPVPEISTTAKSIDDREEKLVAFDDGNFIDTVDVFNVAPNKKWVLEAIAYDKNTKKPLILNGKTVEATKEFTSGDANNADGYWDGQVDVEFTITEDQYNDLKGKDIVIFEYLYSAEGNQSELKAMHTSLQDEGQELYVPEIHTELTDDVTGTHIAYPDEEVHFTDRCTYSMLIPFKKYVMHGVLRDLDTGKPFLDENGKQIEASTEFTASETGSGVVEVHFTFNAKLLQVEGKTFSCFEECSTLPGYRRIASHASLEDKEQQVSIPKVVTTASSLVDSDGKIEVTDILSFKGLTPGLNYIAKARLMKPDGTPAIDAETKEEIVAELPFIPDEADGTVSVVFPKFTPEWNVDYDTVEKRTAPDGSTYDYYKKGWSYKYVVFEKVYVVKDGSEHLIGEHEDLTDTKQTVTSVKKDEGGKPTPTTGDSTPLVWLSIMFLISACGIALILWRKRKVH